MTRVLFRPAAALLVSSLVCLGLSGCKGTAATVGTGPVAGAPGAAITTATPPPGPFNVSVMVTLKTDKPASLFATIDGTDPHTPSGARLTGQNQIVVKLTADTTIKVFSRTAAGLEEPVQTLPYVLAGGAIGTITGVIVVGAVAVNQAIALQVDGQVALNFPALNSPGQIPFTLTNVKTGSHSLKAASDRNHDGNFFPVVDYFSPAVTADIDTSNPFKAAVDNVTLLLGASDSGLCTIEGTITVPTAALGQIVRVSGISASALSGLTGMGGLMGGGGTTGGTGGTGGGTTGTSTSGIQGLLQQLLNGYQVFAMGDSTQYPYAITNLEPGSYVVLPALTNVVGGGVGINFLANPFAPVRCPAGGTVEADYAFGPDAVSGDVTISPTTPPTSTGGFSLVYGMVATRTISLTTGIQAVLMPVFFTPGGGAGHYNSGYKGVGLTDGSHFDLRAYTSLDAGSTAGTNPLTGGPIIAALTWVINPLSTETPQASFTANAPNITQNVAITTP